MFCLCSSIALNAMTISIQCAFLALIRYEKLLPYAKKFMKTTSLAISDVLSDDMEISTTTDICVLQIKI